MLGRQAGMVGVDRLLGRVRAVVVLAFLCWLSSGVSISQLSAQQTSTALALTGVTVVDVTDGRLLPNQTVVVAGTRIRAVGPAGQVTVPAGAQLVDARGKFLIPGLWDMHAHTELPEDPDVARQDSLYRMYYPLYIAHGITGIREMAQRFPSGADSFRVWQRAVQAGTRVGPRAIGPSADLTTGSGIDLQTPENARRIIDSLKAAGDAFAKFHGTPDDPAIFFALLSEARRVGLPIAGHLPTSVSPVEAADSGIRSIEHIDETRECMLDANVASWDSVGSVDTTTAAAACAAVAKALVRSGTWLTPTLFPHYMGVNQRTPTAAWSVRALRRSGVRRFLAGTDCGQAVFLSWGGGGALCPHGSSLLVEVVLLVGAGLTPLEALQAATLHPAQAVEATDSLGTAAVGKLADLVLLDGNPLADIRNLLRLRAVVANGRYFDRAALDALDPAGAVLDQGYLALMPPSGQIRRGDFGGPTSAVSDEQAAAAKLPATLGVVVAMVPPHSPVEAAGLTEGDIIVAINGKPVTSLVQWEREAAAWKPAEVLDLDVITAAGVRRKVSLTLKSR